MSEFVGNTPDEIREMAEQRDCEVVVSSDTELQLDLDDIPALDTYTAMMERYKDRVEVTEKSKWSSRSGNKHVVLQLTKPLDIKERILLQLAFGSDRQRELLSYLNFLNGHEMPLLLFKPR